MENLHSTITKMHLVQSHTYATDIAIDECIDKLLTKFYLYSCYHSYFHNYYTACGKF